MLRISGRVNTHSVTISGSSGGPVPPTPFYLPLNAADSQSGYTLTGTLSITAATTMEDLGYTSSDTLALDGVTLFDFSVTDPATVSVSILISTINTNYSLNTDIWNTAQYFPSYADNAIWTADIEGGYFSLTHWGSAFSLGTSVLPANWDKVFFGAGSGGGTGATYNTSLWRYAVGGPIQTIPGNNAIQLSDLLAENSGLQNDETIFMYNGVDLFTLSLTDTYSTLINAINSVNPGVVVATLEVDIYPNDNSQSRIVIVDKGNNPIALGMRFASGGGQPPTGFEITNLGFAYSARFYGSLPANSTVSVYP